MAYPLVKITNATKWYVSGKVDYMSPFCSNDDYGVGSLASWEAKSRGICLLTKITAQVQTDHGTIEAKAYESSGTSYSQFAVLEVAPGKFIVTRVVQALEDEPPADYVEPAAVQK